MRDRLPRADWYRRKGYKLWRISLDQRRDVPFEYRRPLAVIAEEFEARARKLDRELPDGWASELDRKLAAD